MSEQTRAALADAIAAHVADETDGDAATAWLVLAETTSLAEWADGTSSMHVSSRGSRYTLRGMAETWRDLDRTHIEWSGDDDD